MGRKCYISFKTEDESFKDSIQNDLDVDFIDKSLNDAIDSEDEDYILRKIREDYISDSTVTIFLIGEYSNENLGYEEQKFIKRELQASLYNGSGNTRNGILGVVLPKMKDTVWGGKYFCDNCNSNHNLVRINDLSVISEFSYNYYIPNNKCAHSEDDRYCVLVSWSDFEKDPESWIERAFEKRTHEISKKVKVKP